MTTRKEMKRLDTVVSRADEDENDSSDSDDSPKKTSMKFLNKNQQKSSLVLISTINPNSQKKSPKKVRASAIDFRPNRNSIKSEFTDSDGNSETGSLIQNKKTKIRGSMRPGRKSSQRSSVISFGSGIIDKSTQNQKINEIVNDEETRFPEHDLDEDEKKKEDQRLEKEFEEMKTLSIDKSELLYVQFKNPFERANAYSDAFPFLFIRKKIYFLLKFSSWISFKIIKHPIFEAVSLFVIMWNSLMMAIQNDSFEDVFTYLYVTEMSLKILGMGFIMNKGAYLRESWNILDFVIVMSSLIPLIINSSTVNISVLRSFRVLRPLKTISSIKNLKVLLLTLFSALPMLLETLMILFFFFMIFAIAGLQLYMGLLKKRCFIATTGIPDESDNVCGYADCPSGDYVCGKMIANPNWGITNFDNIFYSLLNVFQCVTLEGWFQILVFVERAFHAATLIYFITLVFIGAFFLLNLTLAVIKLKFTQSQHTKEIKLVRASDKVEEIELESLRTFKKGERHFYRKRFQFLLEKFDDYGANPNHNAINNSPMLEFFENILVMTRRKSRRSTILKNTLGNGNSNGKIKIVKIPKVKPSKKSESKAMNVRGVQFKGFTGLPVIDEKAEIQSPRYGLSPRQSPRHSVNSFGRPRQSKISRDSLGSSDKLILELDDLLGEENTTRSKSQLIRKSNNPSSMLSLKAVSHSMPRRASVKKGLAEESLALLEELEELRRRDSVANKLNRLPSQLFSRRMSKMGSSNDLIEESKSKESRRFSVMDTALRRTPSLLDSQRKNGRKSSMIVSRPKDFTSAFESLQDPDSNTDRSKTKDLETKVQTEKNERLTIIDEGKSPLDSHRNLLEEPTIPIKEINNEFKNQRRVSSIKKIFDTIFGKQHEASGPITDTPKRGQRASISTLFKIPEKQTDGKFSKIQLATQKMMFLHELSKSKSEALASFDDKKKSILPPPSFYSKRNQTNKKLSLKEFTRRLRQVYSIKDFKFGVLHQFEFDWNSYNDVLDLLLKKREEDIKRALFERVNNMRYAFTYNYLQEIGEEEENALLTEKEKKKRKKKKKKQNLASTKINRSFRARTNTMRSGTSIKSGTEKLEKEFKLPLAEENYDRIMKLRRGNVSNKVFPEEEINLFTPMESPALKRKKKQKIKKEDANTLDYETIKARINEPMLILNESDDIINKTEQSHHSKEEDESDEDDVGKNDTYYRLIREKDLNQGVIGFHNFSGQETMEESKVELKNNRFNRIMNAMATISQDKVIWIEGFKGLMIVLHKHIYKFVDGKTFLGAMNLCVVMNTTILAMDGLYDTGSDTEKLMTNFNFAFTIIFAIEMTLKLIALSPVGYVKEKMNIFDGFVVIISIVELTFTSGSSSISALRGVRILRTFRVLRVTRLLRSLAFMQIIINVISKAIQDFIYIGLLLVLFILIYSLLGMQMFAGNFNFPDPPTRNTFDDFNAAFITVFQILTMENWQEILFACLRTSVGAVPGFLYLLTWIFIGNMVFLNLFLTILLEGFTNEHEEEPDPLEDATEEPEIKYFIKDSLKNYENKKKFENFDLKLALTENVEDFDNFEDEGRVKRYMDPFDGIECEDSLFLFPKNWLRRQITILVKHPNFETVILTAIIISSLKLGVDTYLDPNDPEIQNVSDQIDKVFTIFFACEACLKIISFGFLIGKGTYLQETWNQLDFFIVCSSVIDMALENIDIPVVKILRLLRTLRPLRFISHNLHLKIVVTALLESLSGIINVVIVVFLVWLMFGILGLSLIGRNMQYCKYADSTISYDGVSKDVCATTGGDWQSTEPNFSNIFNALITLFVLSTLEGWPDIMYLIIDSNGDSGPSKNANPALAYFVIAFILIGTLFLMNLFVGVIFFNFMKAQASEMKSLFLTPDQQHWVDLLKKIPKAGSDFSQIRLPKEKFRLILYKILNHGIFDTTIMLCIIFNIITMAMVYEGSSDQYDMILENINYFFTGVFILEAILKIIAYGPRGYWYSAWNRFDAFVVLTSILDIMMSQAGQGILKFMKSGTQLARIFRVLRVTRLLKLIRSLEGLQKIIEILLVTLPSLMNVGALLFLIFFIYSILGVSLFKDVTTGVRIDDYSNFGNFGNALVLLFRCATGEDWYLVMFDVYRLPPNCVTGQTCGSMFAPLYFLSFILICTFVMLNLFILIIIQQFEERATSKTDMVEDYKEYIGLFRKIWSVYSVNSKGVKVHQKYLIEIFKNFKPPFGFETSKPRNEIAKEIMLMNITGDHDGFVYFNEVLLAAMKRAFIDVISSESKPDVMEVLSKAEFKARKKIENEKAAHRNKERRTFTRFQTFKDSSKSLKVVEKKKLVNPIFDMLYLGMIFKAYMKFSFQVQESLEADPDYKQRVLAIDYETESEEESLNSDEYYSESSDQNELLEEEEESDNSKSDGSISRNNDDIELADRRLNQAPNLGLNTKLKSEGDEVMAYRVSKISKFNEEP